MMDGPFTATAGNWPINVTEWRRRHPGSMYLPGGGTPDVVDLDETMRPWNDATPAALIDHPAHYTFDA
jgi:tyrosinase